MKRQLLWFFSFICIIETLFAQNYDSAKVQMYIEKYKDYAIESMQLHKIPASITLAQGIYHTSVESNHLAKFANNHFSIPCSKLDTKEKQYRQDNNPNNVCFRKYNTIYDSYLDHGVFISTRNHYKSLFTLDIYDYESWAKELQKLGYSVNKNYAQNLINIINKYHLDRFDQPLNNLTQNKTAPIEKKDTTAITPVNNPKDSSTTTLENIPSLAEKTTQNKTQEISLTDTTKSSNLATQPEFEDKQHIEPSKDTRSQLLIFTLDPSFLKQVRYPLSNRPVYENEGVKFLIAQQGDTYSKIAQEIQLIESRLREYNDVYDTETELQPGEVVYVEMKNRKSTTKYHTISYGETLRYIAQKYAIQLIVILKNNGESNFTLNEEICISCK